MKYGTSKFYHQLFFSCMWQELVCVRGAQDRELRRSGHTGCCGSPGCTLSFTSASLRPGPHVSVPRSSGKGGELLVL